MIYIYILIYTNDYLELMYGVMVNILWFILIYTNDYLELMYGVMVNILWFILIYDLQLWYSS